MSRKSSRVRKVTGSQKIVCLHAAPQAKAKRATHRQQAIAEFSLCWKCASIRYPEISNLSKHHILSTILGTYSAQWIERELSEFGTQLVSLTSVEYPGCIEFHILESLRITIFSLMPLSFGVVDLYFCLRDFQIIQTHGIFKHIICIYLDNVEDTTFQTSFEMNPCCSRQDGL